ncbi:3-dehydroquinate synthase, partial [Chloroflexota bacterium]
DAGQGDSAVVRPLLAGDDPLCRIEWLKAFRQPYYALCHWTVHTDNLSIAEACDEVIRGWQYARRNRQPLPTAPSVAEAQAPYCEPLGATCTVTTATARYPMFISHGALNELGGWMRDAGLAGSAVVISDEQVFGLYGERVIGVLADAGFSAQAVQVPEGETSKSFARMVEIYDFLVEHRVEREHAIVALGGGVVGDLAGFVAATFLRGLPLVQVPTSLMAMVDSSIGGKVAVNHLQAKNLIGAFYQPRLVVADLDVLNTLPGRELISGWAEVVKHALILDHGLFDYLDAHVAGLVRLERESTGLVVARSAAIKARVVSEDEKETGIRTLLNYGHTIGHALEAAAGYQGLLHGEAVATGMMGAALISERLDLLPAGVVEWQRSLLDRFGLPSRCEGVVLENVLGAMELDKKVQGGEVRWVLLRDIGQAVIRQDVPRELVVRVVEELVSA